MTGDRIRPGDLFPFFVVLSIMMFCLLFLALMVLFAPEGYERRRISGVECIVAKDGHGGVSCDWPRP